MRGVTFRQEGTRPHDTARPRSGTGSHLAALIGALFCSQACSRIGHGRHGASQSYVVVLKGGYALNGAYALGQGYALVWTDVHYALDGTYALGTEYALYALNRTYALLNQYALTDQFALRPTTTRCSASTRSTPAMRWRSDYALGQGYALARATGSLRAGLILRPARQHRRDYARRATTPCSMRTRSTRTTRWPATTRCTLSARPAAQSRLT